MKVKKILAAVLALMMIASLAACGKKADDNNNGDNNTDNSLQRVLDAGKLTIGAEGNWIPTSTTMREPVISPALR